MANRSTWKGPYVDYKLLKKVEKAIESGSNAPILTWARSCMIISKFVGRVISVHNGKTHIPVLITEDMLGHKLGEFSPTRIFKGHSGDKTVKGGRK